MKLLLIIASVLCVCFATTTTTPGPLKEVDDTLEPEDFAVDPNDIELKPDDSDLKEEEENGTLYDGIDLKSLSDSELEQLANAEDEEFVGELDVWGVKSNLIQKTHRRKRWVPIALGIGRMLLGGAIRRGITRSGIRLTRHYAKSGGYRSALRDFSRLRTQGTKAIRGNKGLRGYTGQMGRHRVTVRSRSSNGKPTLEIRSPKRGGGTTVRKFRYGGN